MNAWLDTLINIQIFGFILALVWLYCKDFGDPDDSGD